MGDIYTYNDLINIIAKLRSENGCPWDREQTHQSLISNLLEESYELVEALENNDMKLMQEELGDVLLQVMMHAQMASESGAFTMKDVVNDLATKLVHRHPHVFMEGQSLETSEQVLIKWEEIKKEEKNEKSLVESMERVAKTLPALMRTQKIQKKVIKEHELPNDQISKIEQINQSINELTELKEAYLKEENAEYGDEIGEILFGVVKISTFFDINAEFALTKSLEKFINRFRYIENSRFLKG